MTPIPKPTSSGFSTVSSVGGLNATRTSREESESRTVTGPSASGTGNAEEGGEGSGAEMAGGKRSLVALGLAMALAVGFV